MSKLEAYSLRFALILRVAREIRGTASPDDPITAVDFENGIELARWFRDEAIEVYKQLRSGEGSAPSQLAARAAVVRQRFGGAVTVREWQKLNTRRSKSEALSELEALVKAQMASWRMRPPGPKGGRPTKECALLDPDSGGEVSGCGLRVAGGESPPARRHGIAARSAVEGGGAPGGDVGCNPKPPETPNEGREPTSHDGAESPKVSGPNQIRSAWGTVHVDEDDHGLAGGRVASEPELESREESATRNPQPETPAGAAARADAAESSEAAQPGTTGLFDALVEMFDGVKVPPTTDSVPIRDPSGRAEWSCYRCGHTRPWRGIYGGLVCGNCHPPSRQDVEWIDPEEVHHA